MRTRKLGQDGPEISVIGLGTWAIGGGDWPFGWGQQDDRSAIEAITHAVELGVNWIDTAAVYGFGHSEVLVGKAVRQIAADQRPLIATKCGRLDNGDGTIGKSLRRESVIAECEASLRRLEIDCIDLYQMHWPEPDAEIEEGWQTLCDLKQQGKVRYIGVSNHSAEQMKVLQGIAPIQSSQPPYSMIADEAEGSVLPHCGENGIGVVCYSPMGKGMLTGAFDAKRAMSLGEDDHRSRDPRFQSPQLEINLRFVQGLKYVADGLGWTLPELAIAWVLRREEVTSAIVGSRSPEQIKQTVSAASRVLDKASLEEVEKLILTRHTALSALGGSDRARV